MCSSDLQSAAWIPAFDIYDDWRRTPYEDASATDWFRLDLNGKMMTREWRRLRAIAPRMWLGAELLEGVDIAALEKIADVSRHGALTEIRLRESVSLIELERALQARLPLVTRAAA